MPSRIKTHTVKRPGIKGAGARNTTAQQAAYNFRSSSKWRKFRHWFKKGHPLCADPFNDHRGYPTVMQQVHHIRPLIDALWLGLIESNCAALCTSCHSKIETLERAGTPTQDYFKGE